MNPDAGHTISPEQMEKFAVPLATKTGEKDATGLISDLFMYHAPTDDQIARLQVVRETAKTLAMAIHASCPPSADRTAAMRQLQDAIMTANRSIVLNGRAYR